MVGLTRRDKAAAVESSVTTCPCGAPLGPAAVVDRPGSISVEQVTAGRAVERCLRCAEIDERSSEPVSPAPIAMSKRAPERRRR